MRWESAWEVVRPSLVSTVQCFGGGGALRRTLEDERA